MTLCGKDDLFFPYLNQSLKDIFINSNDIISVFDKNEEKSYKYNYDMMLVDLYSKHSWSRLPTELILMVISRIYKIQILIYHNNSTYVSKVNVWENCDYISPTIIRLGQLNEEHYVPITQITSSSSFDIINKKIKYVKAKNRFHKWARELIININKTIKIIGLPIHIDKNQLIDVFEFYGAIEDKGVWFKYYRDEIFAFIRYESEESSKKAISKHHMKPYGNMIITIELV